jgi:hypothetical protein
VTLLVMCAPVAAAALLALRRQPVPEPVAVPDSGGAQAGC